MKITRDDETHIYHVDDGIMSKDVPGITGILKKSGLADLKHIPKGILAMAAQRGTRVHEGMEAYIKGEVPEILTDDVRKRIENGARYLDREHPGHEVRSEEMRVHPKYWYACTLDLFCLNCGTIEEWKTSSRVFSSHHAQVTAQKLTYSDHGGLRGRIVLLLPEMAVVRNADHRTDLVAFALGTYYEVVKKWGPGPSNEELVQLIEERR
jgi:hypothetical protein